MKKIAKILSIGLSALMLISTSSLAASAASVKTYKNAAVISSSGNCDLSKLNQLCKNGKCDKSIIISRECVDSYFINSFWNKNI